MMRFAEDNKLLVHGHNLCWNAFNPPWVDAVINKSNARQFLVQHITTVMKRYAGRIDSWDIVNEPVVPWDSRRDGLYPGVWVNSLGPEYIDIAFHTAAEADPKALRVLNFNHVEYETPDCAKTQERAIPLLKQYLGRGVPIQAIGLESHMDASQPLGDASLVRFVDTVRGMGLDVLITELDVNDTQVAGDIANRDREVARCYHDYLMRIGHAGGTKRVIFWTPSDQWVWLNSVKGAAFQRADRMPHRAGLWDENMRPKPSYDASFAALQGVCAGRGSIQQS
jgi:endo-1,4-beta-xylanase